MQDDITVPYKEVSRRCYWVLPFSLPGARQRNRTPIAARRWHRACARNVTPFSPRRYQSPNSYAPPFETIANIRGMSSPALWSMLHTSHRRMPNIILRPEETRAIVTYILTLQDTP